MNKCRYIDISFLVNKLAAVPSLTAKSCKYTTMCVSTSFGYVEYITPPPPPMNIPPKGTIRHVRIIFNPYRNQTFELYLVFIIWK